MQRVQLENWKPMWMKEMTEISLAWSPAGLTEVTHKCWVWWWNLFMPKLHGSNKSLEYIYIYTKKMRLFPSECEPVRKLWCWYTQTLKIDYTVLNLVFYTKQHIYNIVKLEILWFSFTVIRQDYQSFHIRYYHTFFSSLLLLLYWEKRKNQTEGLFFKVNNCNKHSQNPLKIKRQWRRVEGIWRAYASNQSKFRYTKLWPTLWTRAGPTGFYDWDDRNVLIFNVLFVKSIFICKCTQNTIFSVSHWSVGTKTTVSFPFSLWKWNCRIIYQAVNC